jgi:hypothetical protein
MDGDSGLLRLGSIVMVGMILIGGITWASGLGRGDGGEKDGVKASVARSEDPPPQDDGVPCRLVGEVHPLPDEVHEASGLALSRGTDGLLWTIADAGEPVVVGLGEDGAIRGTVRVTGAEMENWEDIASGPCAGGHCLFVGDIGDNAANRGQVTVYRIPEPDPAAGQSAAAERLHATYPDGSHDAEAMFLDAAGRIYVVTKGETGPVAVYRFPEAPVPDSVSRLERVLQLTEGPIRRNERITGASTSPDGRWVALRSLQTLALYPLGSLTGADSLQRPARFDLSGVREPQGEGVALGSGGSVFLASEGGRRRDPALLSHLTCPMETGGAAATPR